MTRYTYVNQGPYTFRRWEGVYASKHDSFEFCYKGNKSIKLIILDIKDDLMLAFDVTTDYILLVGSPNKIIWSKLHSGAKFAGLSGYINAQNRTVNILADKDSSSTVPLITVYDLYTGRFLNSIPYPNSSYTLWKSDLRRWGHYLLGWIADGNYFFSYNMNTGNFAYKKKSESYIYFNGRRWELDVPNFVSPSIITDSYGYLLLDHRTSTTNHGVNKIGIARIDLETLEYVDAVDATGDEISYYKYDYFAIAGETGINYFIVAKHSDTVGVNDTLWKHRFYHNSYIDKSLITSEFQAKIHEVTRDKGMIKNLWVKFYESGDIYWLQEFSHTFEKIGEPLLLRGPDNADDSINIYGIFTSSYLFDTDLEYAPSIRCKLLNIIGNQYIFKLIKEKVSDNYNFNITNVYYDGVELSFSHDETKLIIYKYDDWLDNTQYICDVKIQWTDTNTDTNFNSYTEAITMIDENLDGENDYDYDIIIPDEYYDTTNLKLYIERRYRDKWSNNVLYNYYDIRIANPIEGGTPWYNLKPTSDVLKVNWKAKYSSTGEVICTGNTVTNVTNEGWTIGGRININIPTSYLDSSNRATLILEVETPTGEWIVSDKFQINNYSNEYNYKWRYNGEDDDYLYFILDGDYSITNEWYKPDNAYLYDGEERITSYMSHTISIVDGVATMKVSKSSYDIENIPKHGYWCNFRCSGYGSSNYRGYGGVEKFEFTVKLQIRTITISQNQFEVIQQNNKIYIANAYFTENVEVYKDGVKLEGSYDKDSGEIKFILPKDTPQELNGHTLNLQYKVFYNDNDEIKSFMQDFTYTTYASYFVELDPDFKDYYWEQLSPTPYNYNYNNGCMVSHGDYIYLVGTAYDNGYKKLLLRYNIESDTWTELASPEYDVYTTRPVIYNNKIYVVGGKTHSTWDRVTKVQIYDIETDSWSYGTDCPRNQGPHELQPIEYNGKIYCFSGYDYDYPSPPNKMDIYDIETDSWESIETPYNLKRYSASCIDGKIYICNGTDSNYNYDTTLYIYDIEANTWTTGPNQPVATYGSSHGGGTMLDKFVVILGDFKESVKTMSFDYDISQNKWMRLPDAPNELGYSYENAKCCRNNNEFYVLKYQYFYRLIKAPVYYTDSYLYEYEGKYYTENENGELVETTTQELNEDLFLNEGVSYINSDLIKPNTKVLYYKVENKDVVPQLKYSGVYEGATITMEWDLQSEQGKTFNVLGDVYSDDNVRFLLSNNKGQSWLTFNGYEVVSCDINNIKDNGMTYDVFTSLIPSQLQSFKGGTNSLRIAIYIEQYSVNGKTNIDHIRLRY